MSNVITVYRSWI